MSSSSPVFDKAEDDLFGAGISKADANTLCFKLELANGPEQHNCTPNELMIRVVQLVSREVSFSDRVKECIKSVELVDTLLDLLLVRAKSQRLLPPILFRGKLLNEAQSLIISLLVQLLDDVGRWSCDSGWWQNSRYPRRLLHLCFLQFWFSSLRLHLLDVTLDKICSDRLHILILHFIEEHIIVHVLFKSHGSPARHFWHLGMVCFFLDESSGPGREWSLFVFVTDFLYEELGIDAIHLTWLLLDANHFSKKCLLGIVVVGLIVALIMLLLLDPPLFLPMASCTISVDLFRLTDTLS